MQVQQSPGPSAAAVIFGQGDNYVGVGGGSAGGTSTGNTDNTKTLVNAMAKDIRSQRIVLALVYGLILQMTVFISLHTLFAYPYEDVTKDVDKKSAEVDVDVNKESSFGLGSFMYFLGTTVIGSVLRFFVAPFMNINFVGLAFVSCICTIIIGYRMQAQEHVCASMKEYVSSWISGRLWLEVCVFGILAGFMTNCYIHALNWAPRNVTFLSAVDDEQQGKVSVVFLNEKNLFIYFITFATGVYIYSEWSRGFKGGFTLEFPTVPLKQAEVIRNSVIDLFSQTITEMISVLPLIYFGVYLFYRLCVTSLVDLLGYGVDPADELTLVSVGLWIRAGFLCFLITYIFQLLYVVVQVTMTEELGLSLANVISANRHQFLLTDAMNCKDIYLQHLGFHTFKMSANPFRPGVAQFYELSHPGSHPRNWTSICTATLQACDILCKELTADFLKPKSSSSSVKPPEKQPSAYLVTSQVQLDKGKKEVNGQSPRYRGEARSPTIRFLASTPASAPAVEEDPASYLRIVLTSPWIVIRTIALKLVEVIMKRFTWVLRLKETWERPKPELALCNIVSSYQLVLWGVNGLVEIVCMSHKMDKHGVVQKDMSKILQKFVDLYKTSTKVMSDSRLTRKSTAKVELISQAALYAISKIHVRFGQHYEMLRVDKDYQIYAADIAKMEARRDLTDHNIQPY